MLEGPEVPNVDPSSSRAVVIGFDFGSKNIGVAIGQRITGMAAPLRTIRLGQSQEPWRTISEVVAAWRPAAFVVGLAYQFDGTENPITPATERFCQELERRYRIPVHRVDETLSTAESRQRFYADNRSCRALFRDLKDELAAQVILQTWLDERDE